MDKREPTLWDAQKRVARFMRDRGLPVNFATAARLQRMRLIVEEAAEVAVELASADWEDNPVAARRRLGKELADLLYVAFGAAVQADIDLETRFLEVAAENDRKGPLDRDGKGGK